MTDPLNSKELVKMLFAGQRLARIPFIPWVYTHAAKLEQVEVRAMLTDPHRLSMALQRAWRLYKYDAICCPFDPTLEAEICGCEMVWPGPNRPPFIRSQTPAAGPVPLPDPSHLNGQGRMPVVLEAMRRIKTVSGRTAACVVAMAGPLFLAMSLAGDDSPEDFLADQERAGMFLERAGQAAVNFARIYGELEPDILAIVDPLAAGPQAGPREIITAQYHSLGNVARFYNCHPILVTQWTRAGRPEAVWDLNLEGVVLCGRIAPEQIRPLINKGLVVGIEVPVSESDPSGPDFTATLADFFQAAGRRNLFVTTAREVAFDTPPAALHRLVKAIRNTPL
ncbi:MAG: uroporphyrinogen decarboxylase family protein [Thermodesulfobacteriota bacterium]